VPDIKAYYRKYYSGNNIGSQISKVHLESNLASTAIKEKLLLEKIKTPAAYRALASQYKYLAILAYPQFKELYKFAINKYNELGKSDYDLILGGSIIEFIKKLFGWKTAKFISYHLHNTDWFVSIIKYFKRLFS
jgi:hypothetical protein